MPELVRSVASRVRVYFKNRRQSPRLRVRLVFTIGLHRATNGNGSSRWSQSLKGHTRDISANGLGLLVPQVQLHGHHLVAEGRELDLTDLRLRLPTLLFDQVLEPAFGGEGRQMSVFLGLGLFG